MRARVARKFSITLSNYSVGILGILVAHFSLVKIKYAKITAPERHAETGRPFKQYGAKENQRVPLHLSIYISANFI